MTGGIDLELREVGTLMATRLCDLVGTARVAIGTGGDSDVSMVLRVRFANGLAPPGPRIGANAPAHRTRCPALC